MADSCNMTRKTRTRQTRIHAALQSGYCAICHIPYNSLDDHIQSKKHSKLIGEDANYISINGFIDQNTLEPFLNLNGIESIDVNGRQIEKDYCQRLTRNNKNRGMSMERITSSPIDSKIHHHLRSRKQVNYAMSPSMDEDSLSERPDLLVRTSARDRRSQNKVIVKKEAPDQPPNAEVWNSGRPKRRSCIKSKRVSADERLVVDNKTYYKVEVMTTKSRSSAATKEHNEVKQESRGVEERDEKGSIVKFKKLRSSEITSLNNEAENFSFPKKDDSSSSEEEEEEDIDADGANTTMSSCEEKNESYLPSSDNEEDKTNDESQTEDEGSMDSSTSSGRSKKRRRTHAEAFIMDNQKYYKFETPGSRSRYHGSFFSEPNSKSPKHNGGLEAKEEKKEVEPLKGKNINVDLDRYKFSFEMVPSGEKWFAPFKRQDLGEESYMYLSDIGSDNRFILPYQISAIPPLDPKVCVAQYSQSKKMVQESSSRTSCSTPDRSDTNYTPSSDNEPMDEDSKSSEAANSIDFCSENSNSEEAKGSEERVHARRKMQMGRNPRKSPRQHASTLAILSSSIQQRKRKSKEIEPPAAVPATTTKTTTLPPIPEEAPLPTTAPPVNYEDISVSMNQEWDSDKLCDDLQVCPEDAVEFSNNLGVLDVLRIYDDLRKTEDYRSNRRFISGPPVNKGSRRKKINKTGWPNRKKGLIKKDTSVKEETSSVGSANDSEEEPIDCKNVNKDEEVVNRNCDDVNRVTVGNNAKTPRSAGRAKVNSANKSVNLQPVVKVKKLDSKSVVNKQDNNSSLPLKRTCKRRMPASPKSPRMLRKPRGRWYKER